GELDLAEEVVGALAHPDERFEALGIDEAAFFKVDDEVDDLAVVDLVPDGRAPGGDVVTDIVTIEGEHADLAVFVALDHGFAEDRGSKVEDRNERPMAHDQLRAVRRPLSSILVHRPTRL